MKKIVYKTVLEDGVEEVFPTIYRFSTGTRVESFVNFYKDHELEIEQKLMNRGAILFSGISIPNRDQFQFIMSAIGKQFVNYVDGNSPRTKISHNVYTSTEYDADKSITLHNELSYSTKWPSRIFFCCTSPAETGGETPIADGRQMLKELDQDVIKAVRNKGLCYIRNLHAGDGFGPSWQETFETTTKADVEAYLNSHSIQHTWKKDGGLRLMQTSKGIIRHKVTGEEVWFNQIDQFHPTHLGNSVYNIIMQMYDTEADLPMFITFGDGTKISDDLVTHVLDTSSRIARSRRWSQGDLLLLDNELVSHGRQPYTGKREVLVSMLK